MTTTELTATEVANRVRPYVDAKRIGDITLSFIADHIYLEHDYWHIRIRPSYEPESLLRYCSTLSDLTLEIQDNEKIKVTLDPGEPLTGYVLDSSPCCDETESNSVPMRDPQHLTPTDVANLVRPYIANTTFGGVTVWLDETRIVYRNGSWDLRIRPSVEPDPLYAYVEALAKLDTELRQKEGIQVWIIPGKPLTE